MAVDVEVLAHAVDIHVDPAIVLHAANVHRQPRVTLVDSGVDAGGFFEHVGGMAWRALVDLLAGDDADRPGRLIDPIGIAVRIDMSCAQLQRLTVVPHALQADPVSAAEAIAHRRAAQQQAEPFLCRVLATQAVTAQASQLAAVEKHLHPGLFGEGQHGAVQGLGGNVEVDQCGALARVGGFGCLHAADPHRQGPGAQHQAAGKGYPTERSGASLLLLIAHVCCSLCWRFLVMKINLNKQTCNAGKVSKENPKEIYPANIRRRR
ncbi:hypothetical protein D3C79_542830 [compost metagenome]